MFLLFITLIYVASLTGVCITVHKIYKLRKKSQEKWKLFVKKNNISLSRSEYNKEIRGTFLKNDKAFNIATYLLVIPVFSVTAILQAIIDWNVLFVGIWLLLDFIIYTSSSILVGHVYWKLSIIIDTLADTDKNTNLPFTNGPVIARQIYQNTIFMFVYCWIFIIISGFIAFF